MNPRNRSYTVHEVLSMLEDDVAFDQANVHIEPPEVHSETDEDSGEEDAEGVPSNLNRNQLSAPATVTILREGVRTTIGNDDSDENSDTTEPAGSQPGTSSSINSEKTSVQGGKRKKVSQNAERRMVGTTTSARKWKKQDLQNCHSQRFTWSTAPAETTNLPTDPVKLFDMFFDEELIEAVVNFSIQYARSKGNVTFTITAAELQAFLGILLVSGYSQVPRRYLFWSMDNDLHNEAISAAMPRNRFDEIIRYLHLSDNTRLDANDKFSKVRLLISLLNEKFLAYFTFLKTQHLSIDESMVPYFGKHGVKQFIRSKPIRFGYKIWALTTPLGYMVQFEPYQGARGRQTEYPGLGMGGSVVVDLISELQTDTGDSFHLTFDNLFTSLQLVDCLTNKKIGCTGTIRSNRLGDCPLRPVKEMGKTPRGTFDFVTDVNNGITVVRWNDNSVVNVVSNMAGVNPVQMAKRWSRADGRRVNIDQPFVITHYNRTIGGVDRMDQNVAKYRTIIRTKKWWWPLFAYCLDLCINQVWHLHRLTHGAVSKTTDLLAIRRTIARTLLARGPAFNALGRPRRFLAADKRVLDQIRFDRLDHLVEPSKTQLKCASCGKKTKHRCAKCQVGVHDRCFIMYHSQ